MNVAVKGAHQLTCMSQYANVLLVFKAFKNIPSK